MTKSNSPLPPSMKDSEREIEDFVKRARKPKTPPKPWPPDYIWNAKNSTWVPTDKILKTAGREAHRLLFAWLDTLKADEINWLKGTPEGRVELTQRVVAAHRLTRPLMR